MQISFVEPSCNYNIILTEADVNELLSKGYITYSPERIESSFIKNNKTYKNINRHTLMYNDSEDTGEEYDVPVQFVGIVLNKNKKGEWLDDEQRVE